MRVECHSVEDFFMNLRQERPVFLDTIYINKSLISLTNDPVRTSTSVEVIIQLSAIVQFHDRNGVLIGDSLIECGMFCGVDRTTSDGELEGTAMFDRLRARVCEFAEARGLLVLPGILGT